MPDEGGFEDVSDEELEEIDEELDEEEELDRAARREPVRELAVAVVSGVLLAAAAVWAVAGVLFAFVSRQSFFSEGAAHFALRVTQVYTAARTVAYASLFALGGMLIAKLLGRSWPSAGPEPLLEEPELPDTPES
jgi:hypothetical protein